MDLLNMPDMWTIIMERQESLWKMNLPQDIM